MTKIQFADILSKVGIFEQMEQQVTFGKTKEDAVSSLRYAFFYYPESPFQIRGSQGDYLLETLRRNSVRRMMVTLNERFPEEEHLGYSPMEWIRVYGDADVESYEDQEWFQKWYKRWYLDTPFFAKEFYRHAEKNNDTNQQGNQNELEN